MKAVIIMSFCFLTLSCATQKNRPDSVRGITEISFGKSGGFTGMTEEYLITGDAEVFKIENGKRTKINEVAKPVIRDISKQIKDLQFKDMKLSERGNMTYFIEVSANKYKNKVTWSDMIDTTGIKELYKTLVKTIASE